MSQWQSHELVGSREAVRRARLRVNLARTQDSFRGASEQRELLAALEEYAAALGRQGHPLPYQVRSELAMYRAMFVSPPRG